MQGMSESEARALGERWVRAAGRDLSGWRPGMLDNHGRRVLRADSFTIEWTSYHQDLHPWPDFRDAATRGAALEVVRERWGDPTVYLRAGPSPHMWTPHTAEMVDGRWLEGPLCRRRGSWAEPIAGTTEAEALVAALESAP
jgi:hypothetical protein